jgi:hypothetical protein
MTGMPSSLLAGRIPLVTCGNTLSGGRLERSACFTTYATYGQLAAQVRASTCVPYH